MVRASQRCIAWALGVALLCSGIVASSQRVSHAATRVITVEPATTQLVEGQSLTVSGSGFSPSASIGIAQCLVGTLSQVGCDLSSLALATSDATGAFSASIVVHAFLITATGNADCSVAGQCMIGAAELSDITNTGVSVPISFVPGSPPVRGNLMVTPTNYTAFSQLTVSGTAWAPFARLEIAQCPAATLGADLSACNSRNSLITDATGSFGAIAIYAFDTANSVDCGSASGACVILAVDSRDPAATYLEVPLTLSVPTLGTATASVTTNLHHQQSIMVTGEGWSPGRGLSIGECFDGCDMYPVTLSGALVAADGTFSVSINVLRFSYSSSVCGVGATVCSLVVQDYADGSLLTVSIPVVFAPLSAPQRGSLTSPAVVPFPETQLAVDFTGWTPEAPMQVGVCASGVYDTNCAVQYVDLGASGALSGYTMYAETSTGGADCLIAGECEVVAWDPRDIAGTVVANPYLVESPAVGSLVVSPSQNLADQQVVTVSGTGWPANYYMTLEQCPTASSVCGFGQSNAVSLFTDANGDFTQQFPLRDSVSDGHGWQIDCTQSATTCAMAATLYGSGRAFIAETPISFAPTTFSVTSNYSASELAQIQAGAAELGMSTAQFQRVSQFATLWLLAISHSSAVPSGVDAGTSAITSTYPNFEYRSLAGIAAARSMTLPEMQKGCSLLIAHILSLS